MQSGAGGDAMNVQRRSFLRGVAGTVGGLLGGLWAGQAEGQRRPDAVRAAERTSGAPGRPAGSARSLPVTVLDVPKLPYEIDKGVKVFKLGAQPVKAEFGPGKIVEVWAYNGGMPGPTIEVNEGDRVRVIFESRLPEPQTVHWHGLEVPIKMDGVPAISQPLLMPGEQFTYEFTVHQNGTFFY